MTTIEWTDETWNPLRARRRDGGGRLGWACVRVSPGCLNCYAAEQNRREKRAIGGTGLDYTVPNIAKVEHVMLQAHLEKPLHWRKPRRVFVCSMTDLFGEWVTDQQIDDVWHVMARSPQHTFQVLTKRPERMARWIAWRMREWSSEGMPWSAVLPNVWVGTSVEDQLRADERIPHLLGTPAAVRFLSCEPLLGPVDLTKHLVHPSSCGGQYEGMGFVDGAQQRHRARCVNHADRLVETTVRRGPYQYVDRLDWVIVGGESHRTRTKARSMNLAWAHSLVEQCRARGVAPFVKQLGSRPVSLDGGRDGVIGLMDLRSPHGRDMSEWPEGLRIREFPH